MNRYRLVILFLISLIPIKSIGQIDSTKIRIDSTTKFVTIIGVDFKGAIVPKETEPGFNRNELANRFNPTLLDICFAENGLTVDYNRAMKNDSRVSGFRKIKNVRSYFKDYTRQYLGYYNNKNQRIIWIHLVRIDKLQKVQNDVFDWTSYIIFGCGDIFYENMTTMIYNLDTKDLKMW